MKAAPGTDADGLKFAVEKLKALKAAAGIVELNKAEKKKAAICSNHHGLYCSNHLYFTMSPQNLYRLTISSPIMDLAVICHCAPNRWNFGREVEQHQVQK